MNVAKALRKVFGKVLLIVEILGAGFMFVATAVMPPLCVWLAIDGKYLESFILIVVWPWYASKVPGEWRFLRTRRRS